MNLLYRLLSVLFLLVACNSDTAKSTTNTAKDGKVSITQFNQLLAKKPQAKLIDVRTPSEFSDGHVKRAMNIDFRNANFSTKIGQLDKSKPIFIYCQAGGRSGKAYKKMKAMGFREVYDMEGGYGAYKKVKSVE